MKDTSFRKSDNQKSGIPVFGMERRAFFGQAGGGVAGTALSWLLAQDGFFNSSSVRADQKEKSADFSDDQEAPFCTQS